MKKKFFLFILLITSIFTSCTKKETISQIEQIKKDTVAVVTPPLTPTPPKTYTLYKESYLNQRSGIVWYWHDNTTPAWPYISLVDEWLTNPNNIRQNYGQGNAYFDVNKDGYQDILVSYVNQNVNSNGITYGPATASLVWLINKGDNFHFRKSNEYFNQSNQDIKGHKILKTDVNNDGITDFIALGVIEEPGNYGGNFTVLIGKKDGTFDINRIPNPTNLWFHNGACGDLNGDGFVDVITATFIWLGDGKGGFTKTDNSGTTDYFGDVLGYTKSPLVYEILDMNKDGWNDLIISGPAEPTTIVLNNKGVFDKNNQKFKLPKTDFQILLDIEITDFDGDGDLDILQLQLRGGNPPDTFDSYYMMSKIYVYYNNNLNFSADANILAESYDGNNENGTGTNEKWDKYGWSMFKIDDVDGDGIDEIVSEGWQDGTYNALKKVNGNWKKVTITFGK